MSNIDVEKEANIFALCILMPREMIIEDLRKGLDLGSDDDLKMLCEKYGVTSTALTARISLLKRQL